MYYNSIAYVICILHVIYNYHDNTLELSISCTIKKNTTVLVIEFKLVLIKMKMLYCTSHDYY